VRANASQVGDLEWLVTRLESDATAN